MPLSTRGPASYRHDACVGSFRHWAGQTSPLLAVPGGISLRPFPFFSEQLGARTPRSMVSSISHCSCSRMTVTSAEGVGVAAPGDDEGEEGENW